MWGRTLWAMKCPACETEMDFHKAYGGDRYQPPEPAVMECPACGEQAEPPELPDPDEYNPDLDPLEFL